MPKKIVKPKEVKPAKNQDVIARNEAIPRFNITGGIHAQRDVIMGDQTNAYYQTQQTLNITSPVQFIDELQQLKAEIERLKSLPNVEPAAVRRLEVVQEDVQDAIIEAEKDQPVAERIKTTLDSAKETMEKLGGSIGAAVNLGTTLGSLALLALKLFGGG